MIVTQHDRTQRKQPPFTGRRQRGGRVPADRRLWEGLRQAAPTLVCACTCTLPRSRQPLPCQAPSLLPPLHSHSGWIEGLRSRPPRTDLVDREGWTQPSTSPDRCPSVWQETDKRAVCLHILSQLIIHKSRNRSILKTLLGNFKNLRMENSLYLFPIHVMKDGILTQSFRLHEMSRAGRQHSR